MHLQLATLRRIRRARSSGVRGEPHTATRHEPLGHTAKPQVWPDRPLDLTMDHPAERACLSALRTSFFGCSSGGIMHVIYMLYTNNTDDHKAYSGLPRHQAVQHSVAEYVNGQAHVNGVESFWAGLKRGYHGTHHHMSAKHLDRYVAEFCGRHNRRPLDTEDMMAASVRGMVGKRLTYTTLTAEPHDVAAEPW